MKKIGKVNDKKLNKIYKDKMIKLKIFMKKTKIQFISIKIFYRILIMTNIVHNLITQKKEGKMITKMI